MVNKEQVIPIALAMSMVMTLTAGGFAWGQLDGRVNANSDRIDEQTENLKEEVASSKKERERGDARLEQVQDTVNEIKVDLGKLGERIGDRVISCL